MPVSTGPRTHSVTAPVTAVHRQIPEPVDQCLSSQGPTSPNVFPEGVLATSLLRNRALSHRGLSCCRKLRLEFGWGYYSSWDLESGGGNGRKGVPKIWLRIPLGPWSTANCTCARQDSQKPCRKQFLRI